MDVIKFNGYPEAPMTPSNAEVVNGLNSKMWIERYREAGEFTFVADATAAMRNALPIGSLVSHVDTAEVMVVENHEVTDQKGQKPLLTVTGRGFETFWENRVVHGDMPYPNSAPPVPDPFPIPVSYQGKAISILKEYSPDGGIELWQPEMRIRHVQIFGVADLVEDIDPWVLPGVSYTRLLEVLELGGLGIKVFRPGNYHVAKYPLGDFLDFSTDSLISLVIHKGADKTSRLVFSHDTGEIENAEYLWSNKKLKNAAIVQGKSKHWAAVIPPGVEGFDLRILLVDATNIDVGDFPTPEELAALYAAMEQRGRDALVRQKEVALTKAQVSKNADLALYRKDFDVGDIVTVSGAYGEPVPMRISEFVEIEDENGETGQPVLELLQ